MTPRLSLEQITAWGLPAPDLFDLAHDLECEAISMFVEAASPESAGPPFGEDSALVRECRARSAATGVRVHTLECFAMTPQTDVASFARALEIGVELGGAAATAIVFDPDRARATDNLARFTSLAESYDLTVNLEFIALSAVRNLAEATEMVRAIGSPRLRLAIDILHWTRSGGTVDGLAALDARLVGAVQLCDGPVSMPSELQLFHEGFLQRLIPGEGAFAIVDFLRALPPKRLIGVEVPLKDLADQGVSVAERARRAVAGARRMLRAADYGD
jgi:sugar phosphate isomerase/epimerase